LAAHTPQRPTTKHQTRPRLPACQVPSSCPWRLPSQSPPLAGHTHLSVHTPGLSLVPGLKKKGAPGPNMPCTHIFLSRRCRSPTTQEKHSTPKLIKKQKTQKKNIILHNIQKKKKKNPWPVLPGPPVSSFKNKNQKKKKKNPAYHKHTQSLTAGQTHK